MLHPDASPYRADACRRPAFLRDQSLSITKIGRADFHIGQPARCSCHFSIGAFVS